MIKTEVEQRLIVPEISVVEHTNVTYKVSEAAGIIEKAVERLTKLSLIYTNACAETKREIIGSVFTEKFTFLDDGIHLRV